MRLRKKDPFPRATSAIEWLEVQNKPDETAELIKKQVKTLEDLQKPGAGTDSERIAVEAQALDKTLTRVEKRRRA